jgi:predicted metal-dependent enzyme (double-stranded beta helix superfamily)
MTAAPVQIAPERLPQSWRSVVTPPVELQTAIATQLAALPAGTLGLRDLTELVSAVAADPRIWQPLVVIDALRRRYRLAYEDERLDLWVLSWMPGQATGFHDHGTSGVALTAVQGSVIERHPSVSGPPATRVLEPGTTHSGGAGYIHAVQHHLGEPAVTIHAYSPPLGEVGQYRASEDGRVWREPQHGRQELLDHTIAAQLAR